MNNPLYTLDFYSAFAALRDRKIIARLPRPIEKLSGYDGMQLYLAWGINPFCGVECLCRGALSQSPILSVSPWEIDECIIYPEDESSLWRVLSDEEVQELFDEEEDE